MSSDFSDNTAIVAAGGFCMPMVTHYDFFNPKELWEYPDWCVMPKFGLFPRWDEADRRLRVLRRRLQAAWLVLRGEDVEYYDWDDD